MIGARAVARRLAEIKVKGEQRRQQIVLKVLRPVANVARHRRGIEQVEECLVRIERGADEAPGADHFAFGGFDPHRAPPGCALAPFSPRPPPPVPPPAPWSARASPAEPPRDICALAGLASKAAM